jgi:hypothetical protein
MLREKLMRRHKNNESSARDPPSMVHNSQSIMLNDVRRIDSQQIYPEEQIRPEDGQAVNQGTAEDVVNN